MNTKKNNFIKLERNNLNPIQINIFGINTK